MSKPDPIGPWADDIDDAERLARYRSLRALVMVFCGSTHPLVIALARAEVDHSDEAARLAWAALETMPSLKRRHVLASLGTLMRTTPKPKERKAG
jgi:hypothetical protein